MSKTVVDAAVDAVLPSTGWPGNPNNVKLQTALDALKDFSGGNVVDVTTTPYNAATSDNVVFVDGTGGAVTVNLPAAADSEGVMMTFVNRTATITTINADSGAGENIDGGATHTAMDAVGDTITIVCDGADWHIISQIIAI